MYIYIYIISLSLYVYIYIYTVQDFRNFAGALDDVAKHGGLCVVGSKEAIEKVQDSERDKWGRH